jgi:hypothetical protein
MESLDLGEGLSVLDGTALVMGSAVASIHILGVRRWDMSIAGWIMVAFTFGVLGLTAAGPFIYLARRFGRRISRYPGIGDRLWAVLGMPWLVTAMVQSAASSSEPGHDPLLATTLTLGLGTACLVALVVVWSTWVAVPPYQAARVEAAPWTNRVGLILSIAWPIQLGLGMVVLS